MTDNKKLSDCPFCGCAATFVKHSAGVDGTQGFDKWDAVACRHCRATIGACDRRFRNRDDVREVWNRRAASRATDAPPHPIASDPGADAPAQGEVEQAIVTLVAALQASKGWLHDYADAIVRDAIDRKPAPPSEQKPVAWRDALRRSRANTDYHGLVAFTGAQLVEFVGMLATPAASLVASIPTWQERRNLPRDRMPSKEELMAEEIADLRAALAGALVASEQSDPRIEVMAKQIYEKFDGADAHPWVPSGNSHKQDDARRLARAALAKMEGA